MSAPASQTLTITDDEDAPTVTLMLSADDISEDGGVSTVTARLSHATNEEIQVTVSAAAVSPAVAGDLELSTARLLTIAAKQTESTGTVTVTGVDNDDDAPNKEVTISATVSGLTGLTAPASKTLTITDDEGAPTVTLVLSPEEVSENRGASTVTARLSHGTSEEIRVTVSAAAVTPAVAGDFELSTARLLTIAATQTESTGTVTVTGVDNDDDAPDKEVTLSATVSGLTGLGAPASKTLTITDDEGAPTVTLVLSPEEVSENRGVSTVTARLSHGTNEEIRVTVSAAAVTPAVAGDFELSTARVLTIAPRQTESTGMVTVTGRDNDDDAPDKEVTVAATVSGLTGLAAPASKTLTITDDEGTPTVTLVPTPNRISEDDGVSTVMARLSHATSEDVEVTVSAAAVSPAVAGDFALSANTLLTITAGQTESTETVTVTGVDNDDDAPDKEVTISGTVTGPVGIAAPAAVSLTITDDEAAPTVILTLTPTAISEDAEVSTVTARLSHATSEEVRVTISAAAVSPAAPADFELSAAAVLTIAKGATDSAGSVTVTAKDNPVDTPDKRVTISGTVTSGPTGIAAPAPRTLTLKDDDETPTVTLILTPTSISEDAGVSTVTARLNRATSEPVSVTVMVPPAVSGEYRLSTNAVLTIARSQTESSGTVTITAEDNTVDGPDKRVPVTASVSGPVGMTAPATETLTITDDEATPTVTLALAPASISENGGVSRVTARLSHATSEEVRVTAVAGAGVHLREPGSQHSDGAVEW